MKMILTKVHSPRTLSLQGTPGIQTTFNGAIIGTIDLIVHLRRYSQYMDVRGAIEEVM